MSELVPIAGVWYRSGTKQAGCHLYAPFDSWDPTPWYSMRHKRWIKQEELPDDLAEWYNPHPKWETEETVESTPEAFRNPALALQGELTYQNSQVFNQYGEKITTEDFIRAGWVRKKRLVTAWEKVPNE